MVGINSFWVSGVLFVLLILSVNGRKNPVDLISQQDTILALDLENSVIRWRGTEFRGMGKHEGIVRFKSGELHLRNGILTGGQFTIAMNSIEITDMPEHETVPRRRLTNHLKSKEFFYVDKFPTSKFIITKITSKSKYIYQMEGNLTLRGVTLPIEFEAYIPGLTDRIIQASANMILDRQNWGVSFVGNLTDMLVDDFIYLTVSLQTQ